MTIDECEESFYKLLKEYCQPCVTEEPESSDESSDSSSQQPEQSENGSDSEEDSSDSDDEPENPVPNVIKRFVPEGGGIFAYPHELLIFTCIMCTAFYFVFISYLGILVFQDFGVKSLFSTLL